MIYSERFILPRCAKAQRPPKDATAWLHENHCMNLWAWQGVALAYYLITLTTLARADGARGMPYIVALEAEHRDHMA